ncbi:MAG: hypothetical protein MUP22_10680, partial [Desulfobacterales bacterium]|nr:hypothetical protein [Desulfobacterales bacterium]
MTKTLESLNPGTLGFFSAIYLKKTILNKKMYRNTKYFLIITILILFFMLLACSSSKDKTNAETPIAVEIKEIHAIDLPVEVETTGRLSPDREVTLIAEVSGAVKTYLAD